MHEFGGRLTSDPNRSSLGLLPSGPDPVGEWLVHRQPPGLYIGGTEWECKRRPHAVLAFHRTRKLTEFLSMIGPTPPPAWSLHPQLAKDTINVGDLPLSRVLVINDANYPWLLLVPRRNGVSEMIDLDEVEQAQLWTEIARAGRALKGGDRMRQAQHRGARQRRAATARACDRAAGGRRRLAEAGLGRGAADRP